MPAVQLRPFLPGASFSFPPRVYLDTNFVVYARDRASNKYQSASTCLAELVRQNVELNVSALMFDELWCVYLKKSYELAQNQKLTIQLYKASRAIWQQHWPTVDRIMNEIRGWNRFREVPCPAGVVQLANEVMNLNPLAPRDAFHVALALNDGIPLLVTADRDFDTVQLPAGRQLSVLRV